MIFAIFMMFIVYGAVYTATTETCFQDVKQDVFLLRKELKTTRNDILKKSLGNFEKKVNSKMRSIDVKVSKILGKLDSLGENYVMWGDWGDWSACDMSLCNVVFRERPCLGEGGNELGVLLCSRFGGTHTENKLCCDIDVKDAYEKMYSGNDSVPAFIVKATGSNIKVDEREKLSWAVSLKFKKSGANDYEHNCGGVILSNIWVLTAAHCITDTGCWDSAEKKVTCGLDRWTITAGEWRLHNTRNEEQIRGLEHIVVHHNYSVNHFREIEYINDIALIKLDTPLEFMSNPFVQPSLLPARACMEAEGSECLKTQQDWALMTACFTTGWGIGKNGQVTNKGNTIEVAIKENTNHAIIRSARMSHQKIMCMGYSGSPLMCDLDTAMMDFIPNQKMVVLGLNSYIYPSGCIKELKNYTQTSLDYHLKWISHTVMGWIQWSPWSKCFKHNKRYRLRSGFFPEYGYLPGQGPLYQSYQRDVLKRDEQNCTDGVWEEWKNITDCSVTCGVGTMTRSRTCIPPINGGKDCIGKSSQIISCEKPPCTVPVGKLKTIPVVKKRQLQSEEIWDLTVTSSGNLVTTDACCSIKIYDHDYKLIKSITNQLYQVTRTIDDQLAFASRLGKIRFYTEQGKFIRKLTVTPKVKPMFCITSSSSGQLVVCDSEKAKAVLSVDPSTGDATRISKKGTLNHPFYVTINSKGVLIVSDTGDGKIKGLDKDGNLLFSYVTQGWPEAVDIRDRYFPTGVATDAADYIVVADTANSSIQLLTPEGRLQSYLLTAEDGVVEPKGVYVTQAGEVLVGDRNGQLFTITYRD